MTVAERVATHALDTQFSDLSTQARERAATYILDSLGVGIAVSSVAGSEELLRVAL
jgi:2-methylcitrate dehydratase PrpD